MRMVHALGGSLLLGSALFVSSQGCALFTCIEDDCASLSTGGHGVGGASTTTTTTTTQATATTDATSSTGGAGGAGPCTSECPICSDPLESDAGEIAVVEGVAYVLLTTPSMGHALRGVPVTSTGFGAPYDPHPSGTYVPNGQLAASKSDVFYGFSTQMAKVGADGECDEPAVSTIRDIAGVPGFVFVLTDGSLEQRDPDCGTAPAPIMDAIGATWLAAASVSPQGRAAFDRSTSGGRPCFEDTPFVSSTEPSCLGELDVRGVALTPSGDDLVFRTGDGVFGWAPAGVPQPRQIVLFGTTEKAQPMAATETEVFFARETAERIWRCRLDQPDMCRSYGTEVVGGIHVGDDVAYFTMGNRVCRWP